jgi:hypothetical protein
MTKLTWLGPDDYGEGERPPASLTWAGITFPVGVAVEVVEADHPVMVAKAKGNRMFKVEEGYGAPAQAGIEPTGAKAPAATQWREPETEADPADVSFFDDPPGVSEPQTAFGPDLPPDYPPEDNPKRKPGRPRKVVADDTSEQR